MAKESEYQGLYERMAALRAEMTNQLSSDLLQHPQLADALVKKIDEMLAAVVDADLKAPPPDKGLAELVGLGPQAAVEFGQTRIPQAIQAYDETVVSERLSAVGDLYYI